MLVEITENGLLYTKYSSLLDNLISIAEKQHFNASHEKVIYSNTGSSLSELQRACYHLRAKLGFINFEDETFRDIILARFDGDANKEISQEEAAAVKQFPEKLFTGNKEITSLADLKHFTGLVIINKEDFNNCSNVTEITLPENIETIGVRAFTAQPQVTKITLPSHVTSIGSRAFFNSIALRELYLPVADTYWKKYTILPFTGIPVIQTSDAEREYGRTNAKATFEVTGAPVNVVPVVSVNNVATLATGTYPIGIGNIDIITSLDLQVNEGTLTVQPAPVTVTAKSYTRMEGQPNPEFEYTRTPLRNHELPEEVFLQMPVVTCLADESSPAGEYEIVVSGAEAQNYVFTYVNGILTVEEDPDGIANIESDKDDQGTLYDLQGRKIETGNLKRGVYIQNGRKYIRK